MSIKNAYGTAAIENKSHLHYTLVPMRLGLSFISKHKQIMSLQSPTYYIRSFFLT